MNKHHKRVALSFILSATLIIIFFVTIGLIGLKFHLFLGHNYSWSVSFKSYPLRSWITLLLAISVPTFVWCLTSLLTLRNHIKQHSLQILLSSRTSSEYIKHATITNKYLNNKSLQIKKKDHASISYSLNFLEFIASGIRRNDLDEEVFKDSWCGLYIFASQRFKSFIIEGQNKNPNTWMDLNWLASRWEHKRKRKAKIKNILNSTLKYFYISCLITLTIFTIGIFSVALLKLFITLLSWI